jgi:hypothetical protein
MTGRELYERWCVYATGETADYWDQLSPFGQRAWDHLAEWQEHSEAATHDNAVITVSEAMQDAWERREARRCPSTT